MQHLHVADHKAIIDRQTRSSWIRKMYQDGELLDPALMPDAMTDEMLLGLLFYAYTLRMSRYPVPGRYMVP